HRVLVDRWREMIAELQSSINADFAMFSVALRELLDLVQASEHCESLSVARATAADETGSEQEVPALAEPSLA
ncbi:MAG: NAD-glutamate dehydrogenase, partial [Cellvibrionaceae bacterium]|nr:NAD-glutamate dehydrogenase [Cellvibrionaceae bacterium]